MRPPLAALAAAALLATPPARAAPVPAPHAPAAGARPPSARPSKAGARKPEAAARTGHPSVDASVGCASCHADATPEIARAWRQGPHGLALVKCFVCHGSTGDDFARRPPVDRCTGCHAEQVASLAEGGGPMKGKDCFSCHEPHALSPHARKADQTLAARLRADAALRRDAQSGPLNGPAAPPPPYAPPAPPPTAAQPPGTVAQPGAAGTPKPGGAAAAPQQPAPAPAQQPAPAPAAGPQTAPAQPAKDTQSAQPHPTTDKPQGSQP